MRKFKLQVIWFSSLMDMKKPSENWPPLLTDHKSTHLLFILLFSEDHFWMWFFLSLTYIIWRLQVFAPSFFVRDQIREFNSPPTDIEICYTPPRPSEISEKNWSTLLKPFLTSHLWYKAMLKVWRKSWEPFRIYQLTSTHPG